MIKRFVILTIHGYRRVISPWIRPSCRFDPTCSRYAIHAIEHYGLRRGGWMAIKRLFRCQPLGDWGYDPVPNQMPSTLHDKRTKPVQPPSYARTS